MTNIDDINKRMKNRDRMNLIKRIAITLPIAFACGILSWWALMYLLGY